MNSSGCIDILDLELYCRGRLDAETTGGVKLHVACCPKCREELDDIQANLQVEGPIREMLTQRVTEGSSLGGGSIGGYRLIRELGRGGMGVVFLAEQEYPRRSVALKVLLPGLSAAAYSDRFAREANLLAQLHHPGIAQVYEAGVAENVRGAEFAGRAFIAMEYVPGISLDQYAVDRSLDIRRKCKLLAAVCDAVHHAHVNGVIHRDLKPGNILVVESDAHSQGNGVQPKVLDFGVARATDVDIQAVTLQTEVGQVIGTVPYMSPEQVSGDSANLDARSDVYSLGVIGYRLFANELPYALENRTILSAIQVIREVDPPPLSRHDAALRGDVEMIVSKALQKDVAQRYQSAAEMAADLRRFLNDEPIAACPPTALYQLRKFTRRNRALVTATVLVAVSLVVGSALALWQAGAALDARDAAQRRLAVARESADFILYGLGNRHARVFGGTEINRDLMEQVYSYYKRIYDEQPDDLDSLQNVWGSLHSWAHAVHETGRRDRAEEMLHEARLLAERAVGLDPDNALFRAHIGRIDFSIALVLSDLGAVDEAHHRMTNALQAFENARGALQDDPVIEQRRVSPNTELEYWRKLAQINRYLGDIRLAAWRLDDAEIHYDDAQFYCDELAAAAPDDPFYGRREPALLEIERGRLLILQGAFREAVIVERAAAKALEEASAADPDSPIYAVPRADAYHQLARAQFLLAQYAEAAEWARRSAELMGRLLDADQSHVVYRRNLAESYALLVSAARELDREPAEQATSRAESLAISLIENESSGPPERLTAARVLLIINPDAATDALEVLQQARSNLRQPLPEYDATTSIALHAANQPDDAHVLITAGGNSAVNGADFLLEWLRNNETNLTDGSYSRRDVALFQFR